MSDDDNVVSLPYGTRDNPDSGFARGSESSEARARSEDSRGVTGKRQRLTIEILEDTGMAGLTWRELASLARMHHGQASGVLSGLHKANRVARLTSRRDRCAVYVLPKYVNDRPTEEHGMTAHNALIQDMSIVLREVQPRHDPYPAPTCLHCRIEALLRRADLVWRGRGDVAK